MKKIERREGEMEMETEGEIEEYFFKISGGREERKR
jgi:hypothetical protein